jgi:hypothetical protein
VPQTKGDAPSQPTSFHSLSPRILVQSSPPAPSVAWPQLAPPAVEPFQSFGSPEFQLV